MTTNVKCHDEIITKTDDLYIWGETIGYIGINLPSMTHPTCYFEVSIHSMSLLQNQTLIQILPVDAFPILYYACVAFDRKEKIFDPRIVYVIDQK